MPVGCIVAVGRKGSYIGMFAFTCDVVTIPIWITADLSWASADPRA